MIARIAIPLVLAAAVLAFLLPAFAEKRLDRQVRATLLEVQEALQNYHVDEELYPTKTPMTGTELISILANTTQHSLFWRIVLTPILNAATTPNFSPEPTSTSDSQQKQKKPSPSAWSRLEII